MVPVENLIGGVEGKGLVQAQQVFGYTRVMVAAFGMGGGWEALERAIDYSQNREQGGSVLAEKQGYTHKLIVPHVVRLESARAFLEETSARLDAGEGTNGALNTEGAIAKLMASAVDPAWQRQGVGRRMVAEVLNFYRARDYRWIYGQYLNGTSAQSFYRNLGFRCHPPGSALMIPIAEITGQALPAVVGPRIGMETNDCAFDLVL